MMVDLTDLMGKMTVVKKVELVSMTAAMTVTWGGTKVVVTAE